VAGRILEVEHQIYQDAAARVLGVDCAMDGRGFVRAGR